MNWKFFLNSLVTVMFPARCPACGQKMSDYPLPVCRFCKTLITRPNPLITSRTGNVRDVWSCSAYEGKLKDCLRAFKYRGERRYILLFESLIRDFLSAATIENPDIIIPVPLHPLKLRTRKYNQAALIAEALSRLKSIPLSEHILKKTKNTSPQTGLSRKERLINLKNSFCVIDPNGIINKKVLLVDDVITTGATLETCADKLMGSGARLVTGFTLAKTM
ncbi:MAG: ComF family protein [Candidatus Omnitrophota bacterium]